MSTFNVEPPKAGTYVIDSDEESKEFTDSGEEEEFQISRMIKRLLEPKQNITPNRYTFVEPSELLNSLIDQTTIEDRKIKKIIKADFKPENINDYELADLKICSSKLLRRIYQFFFIHSEFVATPVQFSCERLEKVCQMFIEWLEVEKLSYSREYAPNARDLRYQGTPMPRGAGPSSTFTRSNAGQPSLYATANDAMTASQNISSTEERLKATIEALNNVMNTTFNMSASSSSRGNNSISQGPSFIMNQSLQNPIPRTYLQEDFNQTI